jgi:hypothetical protein
VSAALGLEVFRISITVERLRFIRLFININLPHGYLGSNIVSIPENIISIASVGKS